MNLLAICKHRPAIKRYKYRKKVQSIDLIMGELERLWGKHTNKKFVKWDINIRVGKIQT